MNIQNPAQSADLSPVDERVQPDSPASGAVEERGERPFPWMRNRRVAGQPPERLGGDGALSGDWIVTDRYSTTDSLACGPAFRYGCATCSLEVTSSYGGWVVVNDRGQYLRTDGWKSGGDRRRTRLFKTPLAAAIVAESMGGARQ